VDDERFEVLAEWTVRKLRDLEGEKNPEVIIRWVLYSLGVKDLGIDIYFYLREHRRATTTEIAEHFNVSPTTARRYLEQLHSLGIVDYIGREYHLTRRDLSGCIRDILVPRIKKVLYDIAEMAENVDFASRRESTGPVYSRDIRDMIEKAKRDALKSISEMFKEGVEITPETISDFMSKIFDALGRAMENLGRSMEKLRRSFGYAYFWGPREEPRVFILKKKKRRGTRYASGISREEDKERIVYDIYDNYRLSVSDFEYAASKGKKIVINVYGVLEIDPGVDERYAEVVEELNVYGVLRASKVFVNAINGNLNIYGHIEYI